MSLAGVFFSVLFAFLLFVFSVFIASLFVKNEYPYFEPKVSVIIPTFNEEGNIGACLESIKRLDYPKEKMEVIVVDDGSIDNTVKIASGYNAKVICRKHKGKVEALNAGIKSAKYNFIFTADADTVLEKDCLRNLVKPLAFSDIGGTTGNSKVKNKETLAEMFQSIEYSYNNLIRGSFSRLFKSGIWFFGALACYRKSALKKIGGFKKDTLAEDMDVALEMTKAGYRTVNVKDAMCWTKVPSSFKELYKQRARWWIGTLQSLIKNKLLFSRKSIPVKFLYINQFWWSFYAVISLPLIIYQVNYWLPYNSNNFASLFWYIFRWFSLYGPVYVVYKIPEWGVSLYSIFGVLSGIISAFMIIASIKMFRDKLDIKHIFALIFYFPYTIVLNIFISISLIRCRFWKNKYFIKT